MLQRQLVRARLSPAAPDTIADVIGRHALENPDRAAIVGPDFAPFTYRDLSLKISEVGDWLRSAGIGSHSRVGIVLPRGPEAAVLGVSIAAHAVSIPLNPSLTEEEFNDEFFRLGLDAVVLPAWTTSPAQAAADHAAVGLFHATKVAGSFAGASLRQVRQVTVRRPIGTTVLSRSVALILKTSGTTGAAKLIPVTHCNLLEMARKMQTWFDLSADDRCACLLPVYYANGFKTSLVVPLLLGGSVAMPAMRQADDLMTWITGLRPTWFSANPAFLHALLDRLRAAPEIEPRHSLRFIISGSSYLPETVRTELEALLRIPILEFYALSEAGIMAANPAPPGKRKPGTGGLIPRNELAIRNPQGALLPVEEVGEIVVRGPSVSPEDPDTADSGPAFRDEWAPTGDVGFVDSDGYLSIVGRTKELINRAGEKISPYEIEKILLRHPGVREAAAFSVPHPRLVENVAAAVVLRPDADATPTELREFLLARLAAFKVPPQVLVLDRLPRGSSGKISRSQLSENFVNRAREVAAPTSRLQQQIAEIWKRLIGRKDIGIDDNFFEAGGDSLLATQMLLELEAEIRHPLPQSELREAYTIRQLAAAVLQTVPVADELVTCANRGNGPPFFFCHGDHKDRGFYALKLADLLGRDQTMFLLQPCRKSDLPTELTMETMASLYVPHLLALHPMGSFRLGGHCRGGVLAWEIARQLIRAGRNVELVVLIETVSWNSRQSFRAASSALALLSGLVPTRFAVRLRRNGMRRIWIGLIRAATDRRSIAELAVRKVYRKFAATSLPARPPLAEIRKGHDWRLTSNYIPPKIDSRVYALLSTENWDTPRFSPWAWKPLVRELHVERIPGGHKSCLSTHIHDLAGALRRVLSAGPKTFQEPSLK